MSETGIYMYTVFWNDILVRVILVRVNAPQQDATGLIPSWILTRLNTIVVTFEFFERYYCSELFELYP